MTKKKKKNTRENASSNPSSAFTDKVLASHEHLLSIRQKILAMTASGPLNNLHNSVKPSFMKQKLPYLLPGQLSVA